MIEQTHDATLSGGDQGVLERLHGLDGAKRQWEHDLIAEGYTRNRDENEGNIRKLKARHMALDEESRSVYRELRAIRRANRQSDGGAGSWWRRWM